MKTNVSPPKASLIINLYSGSRDGYTFTAYIAPTEEETGIAFQESHLIPYSENYLLDCINNEIAPLRLVTFLEREYGVNLIRSRNCVVCEVRDFRRSINGNTIERLEPVCRQVVLKPTTETLLTDLEHIISKSYEERRHYKRSRRHGFKTHEDEILAYKRMRLCRPDYPFDRDEDGTFVGRDVDVEDKDDLNLDQRHELEKKIVKETAVGLCLDPSKQVGLIANCAQFERFKWNSNELKQTIHSYTKKKRRLCKPNPVQQQDRQYSVLISDDEEEEIKKSLTNGEETLRGHPRPFSSVLIHEDRQSFRKSFVPFYSFVNKCIEAKMLKRRVEDTVDSLKLLSINGELNPGPPPTNLDELLKIGALTQPVEPATLRNLSNDNSIQKTEEYLFETERRKHPHRTAVRIFQRSGMDMFFGELEQDAINTDDSPENQGSRSMIPIKPYVLDPPSQQSLGSKCQFELGSQQSVDLYVKQFIDIFTEDGRRPCKIAIQKQGQPVRTVSTSSYNAFMNANKPVAASTQIQNPPSQLPPPPPVSTTHVAANVVIAQSGAPPPPHNSSNTIIVSVPSLPNSSNSTPSTISIPVINQSAQVPPLSTGSPIPVSSSASPSQTNPPVQIVHPQPRPQPNNIQMTSAAIGSQLITTSTLTSTTPIATIQPGINQSSAPTNVNLNFHLNSTRLVHHRQLLTRPHIYNVNLNPQQPQQITMTRPGNNAGIHHQTPQLIQAQPQHHHQPGIRVNQPTLATLLLTSLPNSGSKPITVAIQPQPQKSQLQGIHVNNSLENHQTQPQQVQLASAHAGGNQQNNPIMIMVGNTLNAQNTISIPANSAHHNIPHHHTGNVSLNLNAINLEGLLAASNNNVATLQQQPTYVTSTALVNTGGNNSITNSMGLSSVGVNNTLNILRLNNTGSVTLQPQIRQNVMNSQHQPTLMSMNSAGTGILVNNSTVTNRVASSSNRVVQHSQVRPVLQQQPPELEEISVPDLNTLLSNGCGNNRVPAYSRSHSKGPSIDLNLNLNLNLAPPPPPPPARNVPAPPNIYHGNVTQNGSVDSIFNAYSEGIPPELEQKLDPVQKSSHVSSSMSPQITPKSSTMTLNDLLGSPPMSGSGGMNHVSSPMQSPQSPSISSILSPISPNVVTSSIAYTTPRLSALLAGTPSADSSGNNLLIDAGNSGNYGNLLDRLMSQGQTMTTPTQRSGGSRLNPIATATPNVILEHPVLAATLTQGTNPNLRQALTRPTAYRQIAPAPPPNLQPAPQQQQHQQQQLLSLLGFVGAGPQTGQAGAIRISTTNATTSVTGGNSGSR